MGERDKAKHDAGVALEARVRPCPKSTWCALARDHTGVCFERKPASHEGKPR